MPDKPTKEQLAKYNKDLLNELYGSIDRKHKALALLIKTRHNGKPTWGDIKQYIGRFRNYSNWTLRDIDKVNAIFSNTGYAIKAFHSL